MRRGDPHLKKVVDDSIKSLFVSGEINSIYDKWFNQPIPPKGLNLKLPMSTELKTIIAHPKDQPAPEKALLQSPSSARATKRQRGCLLHHDLGIS
jgi:glutamate/aspartate transport system substrate-binding protein